MKFNGLVVAAVATVVLGVAGQASAAATAYTFSFNATGFLSAFGQPVPVDPVIGSATVTFDPTLTYDGATAGIVLNSINITLDSTALAFDYSPTATTFSDSAGGAAGELIFGGAETGAGLIQIVPSTNDFYIHIDNAVTTPLMEQFGYTQTASGSSSYFYTPVAEPIIVTTGVPEPAAWSLMLTGVAILGAALRLAPRRSRNLA